ncbi:MAG TPA: VWA domain-containing protein, partial [Gemmataceae bacterium]|nr:VWA domain-containing protein [Gemmataceae bacterium]
MDKPKERGEALGNDWNYNGGGRSTDDASASKAMKGGGDSKFKSEKESMKDLRKMSGSPRSVEIPAKFAPGEPPAPRPAASVEPMAGTASRTPKSTVRDSQSGLLTAGSFDDNLEPEFFRRFAGQLGQFPGLGELAGKMVGHRLTVLIKGSDGQPVGNARVHITGPRGGPAVELTSRSDGRVVFLSSWDEVPADDELFVTVTPPGSGKSVKNTVRKGATRWEVVLPATRGELPRQLDLAIVLDTTGSMSDELEYLKAEIRGIAAAVDKKFPQVNKHYGLILYRDEGDEYVTRRFDFTSSVEEFRKNLAKQSAAGGGDEPEAMHKALEEALQLRWREGNTARVVFSVTDAPPHAQFMERTMKAADKLRKQGVAIYPVACSGYNNEAEFILRSCALFTGSQFIFLTDDSGVGNAHGEPHIPFYHVQKLDKMMIRMIAAELSGKRIEPEKGEIIRTVGRPIN